MNSLLSVLTDENTDASTRNALLDYLVNTKADRLNREMNHGGYVGTGGQQRPWTNALNAVQERLRPEFYQNQFNSLARTMRTLPDELSSFPKPQKLENVPYNHRSMAEAMADPKNETVVNALNAFGPQNLGGVAGILAGRGAKTADIAKLGIAEDMLKKGANRDEIWNSTGWFKGVDGKWRFEIPDDLSVFKRGFADAAMLRQEKNPIEAVEVRDILRHPRLDEAYPDTMRIGVDLSHKGKGGSYGASTGFGNPEGIKMSPSSGRSTALHELQHAIQQREGFARGGSPDGPYPAGARDLMIKDQFKQLKQTINNPSPSNPYSVGAANLTDDELMKMAIRNVDEIGGVGRMEAYRRLAGEAEARLVQKRMNLTPAERQARPPWLDFDVPEAQQIVKY